MTDSGQHVVADEVPGGFVPDLEAWEAWTPGEVAERLRGVTAPWCVAGGWAIELFLADTVGLSRQRREHGDLEIAVPRARFAEIRDALPDLVFFAVGDGLAWDLTEHPEALDAQYQTWAIDPASGRWRLDVMREPHEGDAWIARRDSRIRMPYADLILRTAEGIPYVRPEVALFFKAKAELPKNEDDFAATLPHLSPSSRAWLREAIKLVHPGHAWLKHLETRG